MMWAALKMALALGFVTAALVFLSRFLKKWQGAQALPGPEGGIRVLTSKAIAPQKYVSLVEIAGEVLALGVTAQQITFLSKIANPERVRTGAGDGQLKPEVLPWLRAFAVFRRKANGDSGEER
jgi:flagellar biogenesis protein FliO